MTTAKQKKKRKAPGSRTKTPARSLTERVAQLEKRAEITGERISSIIYGSRDVTRILGTFIVALRDILIAKGVVTAEEAIEFFQIADLESMLDRPLTQPPCGSEGQPGADNR